MTLKGAIEAIASVAKHTPGVVYTPYSPPDAISDFEFPALIIFLLRGEGDLATSYGGNSLPVEKRSVTLRMDLHLQLMSEELSEVAIAALSVNETLTSRIWRGFLDKKYEPHIAWMGSESAAAMRWSFGTMGWGGQDTLGFTYEVDITLMEDIQP